VDIAPVKDFGFFIIGAYVEPLNKKKKLGEGMPSPKAARKGTTHGSVFHIVRRVIFSTIAVRSRFGIGTDFKTEIN